MYELSAEQEAALAFAYIRRDELPLVFDEGEHAARPFIELRNAGMVQMTTDMGRTLVRLQSILPLGTEHYQRVRRARRKAVAISEEADELMGTIYVDEKRARYSRSPHKIADERLEDYRELSRAGLIKVMWADNRPYNLKVTDAGTAYIEGWLEDEEDIVKNEVSPVFNINVVGGSAEATSSSSVTSWNAALSTAIQGIRASDAPDNIKREAETTAKKLKEEADNHNIEEFARALQTAATTIKAAKEIGRFLLPLVGTLASGFFG